MSFKRIPVKMFIVDYEGRELNDFTITFDLLKAYATSSFFLKLQNLLFYIT